MSYEPKAYCTGLHDTGTLSVEKALKRPGRGEAGGNWVRGLKAEKVALTQQTNIKTGYG